MNRFRAAALALLVLALSGRLYAQSCPTAPTLVTPANGATNVSRSVTLQWSSTAASRYDVFLAPAGTGAQCGGDEPAAASSGNQFTAGDLQPNTTYAWRVAATRVGCPSATSSCGTFTTAGVVSCPAATITLTAPAPNTTSPSPVTFSWTAVPNVTQYRLWASADGSTRTLLASTTSTQATVRLAGGTIGVQVEALRDRCPAVLSPAVRVTVPTATTCATNPAAVLVAPNGTADAPTRFNEEHVRLDWNPATGAIGYRVWVARDDQPFDDVALVLASETNRDFEPGRYRWFVEALFESCPGVRSAVAYFNVEDDEPRCATVIPTIVTPAAGATVTSSPVTFSWTAVPGAEQYRVLASHNGGQTAVLGTTTDTTLSRPLPPGTISWAVEAVLDECPSTFSPRATFTIRQSSNCSTSAPSMLLPANGATVTSPLVFNWTPVSGAERYVLLIRAGDGTPTPVAETTETQHTRRLPAGRYQVFVTALFAGCPPTTSAASTFTVTEPDACDNRRPVLFEPANSTVVAGPAVHFIWSAVPNATSYKLYAARGDEQPRVVATTTSPEARAELAAGLIRWFVEAEFSGCQPQPSARGFFAVTNAQPTCVAPARTRANVVGRAISGTDYSVRWRAVAAVDTYEVQESATADFAAPTTQTVSGLSATYRHDVTAPTQFFYRVRGVSNCSTARGNFSNVVAVLLAPQRVTGTQRHASAEIGTDDNIVQTIVLPGNATPQAFSATVDKPWLTVVPASGTVPVEGLTINVVADPDFLHLGTNTATVTVNYPALAGGARLQTHATTVKMPVQVSLVTPVTPAGKSAPPPDALIIPAVAHAEGANDSLFESDIRLTNLGAETMKYQVTYTPSGVDGTVSSKSATVEVGPNQTTALDDVVSSLFGSGTITGALGMLEIRPLTTNSSSAFITSSAGTTAQFSSVASSRTYNVTPTGTFGQFIPAIPYGSFIGTGSVLSLQQIAQSSAYRTNFGFAEGSGNPVNLLIKVYDANNILVKEIPEALMASEHKQINNMLAVHGITSLNEGRVTVEVAGGNGKVTAYASSVDNRTNDPLLVSPVVASAVSSNRYVIPGAAYIDTGFAFWQTDMRVFNAAATSTTATLTFYPQLNPAGAVSRQITLAAGEIKVLDNVVAAEFGQPNGSGGQVVVSTPAATSLVATARTYNRTSIGTYGQFIPGVTPAEAVGSGERALQILQVEHSSRFRTNVGLSETTGNPVTVEVSLITPDSKVTPVLQFNLAGNEFRQFSLADFGLGDTVYNARVTVKAIDGSGRVTAYGSSIDASTQDPTYVPAQ